MATYIALPVTDNDVFNIVRAIQQRNPWLGGAAVEGSADSHEVLFLLRCGLNETLRSWVMNVYSSSPSTRGWLYGALKALPDIIIHAATGLFAVAVRRVFQPTDTRCVFPYGVDALIPALAAHCRLPC
ncbi:hypothetical protein [Mycobacterium stomatepiae]|uniref:Uncharacterized protein n=1 Tax=Mycobacterium stomatepiae TaxID=470076 RepID=A0A7I7Q8Y0_9MYCO|nr:hypothetical protein [Mycobacterium stomatepiae]MCV7164570.1 hypothetical protein [Mycobacterium stomatepiae]BBY22765.1 hypothetical protein MSTO_29700 [Mycobacterium stomatepiae]